MVRLSRFLLTGLVAAAGAAAPQVTEDRSVFRPFPGAKNQVEEMLKQGHEKNLEDLAEMQKLIEELRAELEKNKHQVVSVGSIKKVERIEKLAKSVRSRLKR
jgi:hypothetical protein